MHSNAHFMLSKLAAALPFGIGGIPIFPLSEGARGSKNPHPSIPLLRGAGGIKQPQPFSNSNLLIHLFINQINSL